MHPDAELTHILVVSDVQASKKWYTEVLGAELFREYGSSSVVMKLMGTWLLLVTGGPPTDDKPTIHFEAPRDLDKVSHSFTIRVPDCNAEYESLRSKGAEFLTAPHNWGAEIRCFFRDPDGHLFEISEYTGG